MLEDGNTFMQTMIPTVHVHDNSRLEQVQIMSHETRIPRGLRMEGLGYTGIMDKEMDIK